jgi:hypothetical protein
MRPTRWLPALILTLALAGAPATAALARPALYAPSGTGWRCTTSNPQGNCGPYAYKSITKSNGYNTYVSNNKWGCGNPDQCGRQTVHANTPGDWQVTSNQAAGNTAVLTYPDVQQVFTSPQDTDPPIASFHAVFSHFTEAMHATSGTIAEAGYDIWTSYSSDIMIWVDNANRGTGGAQVIGHATIFGQAFTVLRYGGVGGELIFSLDHNEHTGTVHILATLRWLQGHGYVGARARIGQVDFGWEICSTGHRSETFTVSAYTLRSECRTHGC